ncbi:MULTISPECIES: GMC oxidoreductase [unclassified Leclercia]|uniref:GMC family oxidoreductase N-terminal domain-containing protein n=1 Tax=Leclercia barmai TaxID=2785629 RepID=A0ABS7RYY6_9ENTR|nr:MULTISPECIES: GMC oxidoreductase [unclassified Leclercia]MBZ0059517.1 GMC family oxidoreductase N-terminal domain-containing protein [Leclercia sp. EMC7]MCM5697351.1 GMC family oxidoreductase N-terminal domain-containing protein [Leclercia sp. LTM01]MCM5702054.1 GMC family oxidoreductase N-terminal domain-containing protein [Leclercia sp. LTM14]
MSTDIDVLIIGSGPAGATFARHLADRTTARILMVDTGSALTSDTGGNIRNLMPEAREQAWGQARTFPLAAIPHDAPADVLQARPGTHLLNPLATATPLHQGMPAAAMSSNIGGMGIHWTCACPRPSGSERISFLDQTRLDAAYETAEAYLQVTQQGFPATALSQSIIAALNDRFSDGRDATRLAQPMPLACTPQPDGKPRWSGTDAILGDLARAEVRARRGLEIRPDTLCRQILTRDGVASGAMLRHLPSGRDYEVHASVVVIAADALRTPQLLYASGIRPQALGRWLNDQPQVIALIDVDAPARPNAKAGSTQDGRDNVSGVTWLPFNEPDFPFHGQLMQMDTSPIAFHQNDKDVGKPVVGLGLFLAKDLREDDRIMFSDERDALGMPRMTLSYTLTDADRAGLEKALKAVQQVGAALNGVANGGEAIILPAGTSLHYQGTHRMGPVDDGTCVTSPASRVWGFDNLYLGGNGSIPTATACNPTLTSVALALMAADDIIERFFPPHSL